MRTRKDLYCYSDFADGEGSETLCCMSILDAPHVTRDKAKVDCPICKLKLARAYMSADGGGVFDNSPNNHLGARE